MGREDGAEMAVKLYCERRIKDEDIGRWKELPCSWISRINIVTMIILSKAIYRLNTKFEQFFTEIERTIFSLIYEHKKHRIMKTILNSKRTVGGITIVNLKLYCRAIVIKT